MNSLPRVVDCLGENFDASCVELARRVKASHTPDLWLGIETGGACLLRTMVAKNEINQPYAFIAASRPATKQKKRWLLPTLLPKLPRQLANALRLLEHVMRERRFEKSRTIAERHVSLTKEAISQVSQASRIVLIDDAVDSGSSVVQIIAALKQVNPSCQVIVAVITQTFRRPLRQPDVYLRRNELVRFPWSSDASK